MLPPSSLFFRTLQGYEIDAFQFAVAVPSIKTLSSTWYSRLALSSIELMPNTLRRRGELPPLEPSRELQELEDDIFEVFVDYISPCQVAVSNDPNEIVVTDEPNPCNITLYDCSGRIEGSENTANDPSKIVVEFDYEMHFTIGADFETTLEGLEGAILEHLATATGLADCPITENVEVVTGSTRGLQEFPDLFEALSSDPLDEMDTEFPECFVPVPASISQNTNCQTMTGYLTAFMKDGVVADSDQEAFIKSGLQRFIREGMQNDIYVSGNLRKASFIGKRTDDTAGIVDVTEPSSGSGDGGLDSLGIILLSVGLVVVLAFAVLAFLYRKRRNENEKDTSRDVTIAEPTVVAPEEINNGDGDLYRRRGDIEGLENMEGADIPGSLATNDFLALQKQQQQGQLESEGGSPSSASKVSPSTAIPAATTAAAATGVAAATVASSSRNREKSSSRSRKKKRREKERRKKKLPALETPSLDSIPEEETDDEALAEQVSSELVSSALDDVDNSGGDQSNEEEDEEDVEGGGEENRDDDIDDEEEEEDEEDDEDTI